MLIFTYNNRLYFKGKWFFIFSLKNVAKLYNFRNLKAKNHIFFLSFFREKSILPPPYNSLVFRELCFIPDSAFFCGSLTGLRWIAYLRKALAIEGDGKP